MSIWIPQSSIGHLREYKYQSEDRSLTTKYILKPFWVKFERIFPTWMAPNMVTLLGLLFIVVSDLLVMYFDPYYNKESPQWVYFYHAIAVFMYQTFDACDGIHARRTGQSGPLGELFDHCCDSMNTTLMVIQFSSVANLTTETPFIFIVQFAALANFYLSTWEEFHTHKLFLSEVSGPVEGLIMLSICYILTGIFGVEEIFHTELFYIGDIVITTSFISSLIGMLVMSFNIYSARRNVIQTLKNEKREHEIDYAMKGLVTFISYYLMIVCLFIMYPTIWKDYTTTMLLTIGSCMSFTVGRIITGHLTKQEFPFVNFPMLVPLTQSIAIELLTRVFDVEFDVAMQFTMYSGLGASLLIYGMFVTEIIYDITTYLDIWALTIKHPKPVKDE
ncbi:hypothetical protein CAS74_003167 [Pichia kudriavzevii]|uniref:Cholinephosphotransferase 1 n=1 Tax=Pichia kudriavzevii TaxID=4909 RepID=A0A1Z8JNL6_PICKU|nr:hypothetical protein CAS74_003167 [Pichia kudriavzevii]